MGQGPGLDCESGASARRPHLRSSFKGGLSGLGICLGLSALLTSARAANVDWYRVSNGGGTSSGNGCTIMGTIGQAEPGVLTADNVVIQSGFLEPRSRAARADGHRHLR